MKDYKDIIKLDSTRSTNSYAANLLQNGAPVEFTLIQTIEQTDGRGQINNSWESEKGKNLTCSLILRPDFLIADKHFYLSQFFSIAIVKTLEKYLQNVKIKWPNDIYVNDKKIAGILIENSLMGSSVMTSVLGLGLNINQIEFLSDAPNPTSIFKETSEEYDVDIIRDEMLEMVEAWYQKLKNAEYETIAEEYKKILYRYQESAEFKEGDDIYTGAIVDVKPSGKLIIELYSGEKREYNFKEVEYII